jgi:hypothetical protein
VDARLLTLLWIVQLAGCLYLGVRTARKTGRSLLNWVVMGFLLAVVFPPVGLVLSVVSFLFYPDLMPRHPQAERHEGRGIPGRRRPRKPAGT